MKKHYFLIASMLILFLSLIGFSDNLVTDVGQESNKDPKFIIHGLFCFAWLGIFVVQSNLIRKGDHGSHIKWGVAGMVSAIGVFISTVYIFFEVYESWGAMPFWIKANRFLMLGFAVLVLLGYLNRRKGNLHKRYMFMASLYMLEPVLGRIGEHIGLVDFEFDVFEGLVWNLLFISLFIYDWKILKKIHPVSWVGVLCFYIIWVISILF